MSYELRESSFERSDQLADFVTDLIKGVLPLKFAYIGPAARTHDQLVRSPEYGLSDIEAALIRTHFAKAVLPHLRGRELQIVDVGAGNGLKAVTVLEMVSTIFKSISYVDLDYSSELQEIAARNIHERFPDLPFHSAIVDFEERRIPPIEDLVTKAGAAQRLFLFLGHTLGNPVDPGTALRNIRHAMKPQDQILVGVELYRADRVEQILSHYQNEPFYRAVFTPLTFAGISRSDGDLIVRFNETTLTVEVHFVPKQDMCVRVHTERVVQLQKGKPILIFLSRRFREQEILDFLGDAGLQPGSVVRDDGGTYLILLATAL